MFPFDDVIMIITVPVYALALISAGPSAGTVLNEELDTFDSKIHWSSKTPGHMLFLYDVIENGRRDHEQSPGGYFTNVSQALLDTISKFMYCRDRTSYGNFKLKPCFGCTYKVSA